MKAFFLLVRMRTAEIIRNRVSTFFFLVLPLLLLGTLGLVFANGHPFEKHRIGVVNSSSDELNNQRLAQFRSYCTEQPGLRCMDISSEESGRSMLRHRMLNVVWVPDKNLLIAGQNERFFALGLASQTTQAAVDSMPLSHWGYVHFLFPGVLTHVLMISGLFGMGYTMVRYRQNLFLKKLATTPLPKITLLMALITSRAILTVLQVSILIATAVIAFAQVISWQSFFVLWPSVLLGLVVFLGMGLCLAIITKTESSIMDAISVVSIPLVFLSEIFFLVDDLPPPLPQLSALLPTTQLVRLFRLIMTESTLSLPIVAPHFVALGIWAVFTLALSHWLFAWTEPGR